MSIKIPADRICEAHDWETWTISLFGNPKMEMICGKCYRPFASRDYHRYNSDRGLVMCCLPLWHNVFSSRKDKAP